MLKSLTNYELIKNICKKNYDIETMLDYGCGTGELVYQLNKIGICAYGCDIAVTKKDDKIQRMKNNFTIPFDDEYFDFVTSNQVLEHVENLEVAVRELFRVMKPGAKGLLICPTLETVFEWHVYMPFVHYLNKMPKIQMFCMYLFLFIRIGPKIGKSKDRWISEKQHFLQKFTYYRSCRIIRQNFNNKGFKIQSVEHTFYAKKFASYPIMRFLLNKYTTRYLVGSVFLIEKLHRE